MTDFLQNAESIFETATSADGVELESGNFSILIGQDGAIHMVMRSDWPLDSLQAHHGAKAAYRVSRSGALVRVEGKSRTASCILESEPASSVAKRMLVDRPRYLTCRVDRASSALSSTSSPESILIHARFQAAICSTISQNSMRAG